MQLKGIIDCDFVNYKLPCLTLEFPYCTMKCDKLNGRPICQNSALAHEPNLEINNDQIWQIYKENPLTQAFCCQGLEPFDSPMDLLNFISFIRLDKKCNDPIVIYTGYNKSEAYFPFLYEFQVVHKYANIIIKWGRYIIGDEPHYDEVLGVKLASNNQYAEVIK